jgi:signal transduction histidine kinase
MLRNSIRARLIAGVLLAQIVLAIGVVSTGVYYTKRRLRSSLDAALQARAMSVTALVRYPEDNATKLIFDESLVPAPLDSRLPDLYEIRTSDGSLVVHSKSWANDIQPVSGKNRQFWGFHFGKVPYRAVRLVNVPILDREQDAPPPGTLTVFYAVPALQMNEEVREAASFLAAASFGLVLLTGFIAWWAVRRGLSPLDDLAGDARRINTNNWALPVPDPARTPDELAPLINAMQTMLGNLEQAFQQQRDFIADAAHELKTPIAVLKSTLQSLQQKQRSPEEYRQGIDESLEDIGRLERLVQQLLRLARAEQWASGAIERNLELVDIAETCERSLVRVRGLAKERDISSELCAAEPAFLQADPDDLEVVWANLLENAIHYSPTGSSISVTIEMVGKTRCRVIVADRGPGIPDEELTRIFERFHRGDPSRARNTGGYGLGLAIAKALVEAYRGSISAESKSGQGTRIIVELPIITGVPATESLSLN